MKYFVLFVIFTFLVFIFYLKNESSPKKSGRAYIRVKVIQHLPAILFILILIIGIVVRTHRFGLIPDGVNIDEAAMGYDAYSLLHYGIDMNGYRNPVVLIGFGSGHQSLYAYLSMPFIAFMGLNQTSIKMVNLVFGILSLIIFYLLVRRVDNQKIGLFALFFLAINPWHIMISRWGLDCNLFPAIFLIATYLFTFYEEKPFLFYLSMAIYGLAFYSYETSYFAVTTFMLILVIYLLLQKKIAVKTLMIGLFIFGIVSFPILLYLIINTLDLDPIISGWISIPKTLGPARMSTVSTIFSSGNFIQRIIDNVVSLIRFLIFQEDSLLMIHNFVPGYGTTFLFSFPFQLVGLWVVIKENVIKKSSNKNMVLLIWLVASLLLGLVLKININRMNIIFIPLIYLITKSIGYIHEKLKEPAVLVMGLFVTGFIFFTDVYFHTWPQQVSPAFNTSLDQAINFAADNTEETIYLSKTIHKSFMYVLFNLKIDPHEFLNTVVYENPNTSKRDVSSFGQYRFLDISAMPPDGGAYVISNHEIEQFKIDNLNITEFKNFSVLMP